MNEELLAASALLVQSGALLVKNHQKSQNDRKSEQTEVRTNGTSKLP
jgi:hypothetical protein